MLEEGVPDDGALGVSEGEDKSLDGVDEGIAEELNGVEGADGEDEADIPLVIVELRPVKEVVVVADRAVL